MNDADLRLALVLEASAEGLWEFIPAEGLVLLHPALLALLGYPAGAQGETLDTFVQRFHEDDRRTLVSALFEGDDTFELRVRARHADGGWRWQRVRGRRLGHSSGGKRVIAVQSDVSDEVQREAALSETLARYLSLYSHAPIALIVWDREGRIIDWNPHAEHLFDHHKSGILGRRFISTLFPPEAQDDMVAVARHLLQSGEVHQGDFTNVASHGALLRCRWHSLPLRTSRGTVSGVLSLVTDQTQAWQAEQALREHGDHLERIVAERTAALDEARLKAEANADAKASFLANMSHEIRTPMNAVIGLTRLALRTQLDHRQRDYLERISGAGKLLLGLINDVLDYSKIEAGRLEIEHAPFVLDEVLDTVATLVGGRAQEKGLEFHYVLDAGVPHRLVGDALRLTQVLVNLCGNALKFTATGHVVVRVGAEMLEGSRGHFRFSVEDTGIGLTEEQAGRLFTAFSQADVSTSRKFGGTGLGLMISRKLVQLMDGEITLVSAPGRGTTFYVDLDMGYEPGTAVRSSVPGELAGKTVRVIDDHPLACEAIASALQRLGMQVDIHHVLPDEADDLAPVSHLVIDVELPGARAYVAELHAPHRHTHCPRIVLLAGADIEACESAVEHWWADACLTKPVTVVRLLRALLGERRSQNEPVAGYDELRGHSLLVVDDVAVNRLIIAETLSDWGLAVDQAESAEQALAMVAQRQYGAILMDVQMPGMDGTDATRRLRAEGYRNPVIALTGHSLDAERARCLEAGMNTVITKPVDPDRLAQVLRALLPPLAPEAVQAVLQAAAEQLAGPAAGSVAVSSEVSARDSASQATPANPATTAAVPPALTFKPVDRAGEFAPGLIPGIDVTAGLRRMQGKTGLYRKVLYSFLGRYAGADELIAAAVRAGHRDDALREAHSLKGLAANIGAEALSDAAATVECALREHKSCDWPLAALTLELAQVINGVQAALAD